MRNIINLTRSRDGQITIVQNGVIIHVGQGLTVQIECHSLASRNGNIRSHILQQGNSLVVLRRRNSLCQRLIIGIVNLSYRIGFTQLLNSAVLVLNVTLCNICRNIRGECTAGYLNFALNSSSFTVFDKHANSLSFCTGKRATLNGYCNITIIIAAFNIKGVTSFRQRTAAISCTSIICIRIDIRSSTRNNGFITHHYQITALNYNACYACNFTISNR